MVVASQLIDKQRTRVKFCGITNLSDALHAAQLGIDAIGFVFCKESPRYISPGQAQAIISELPPFITTVGLFVNEPLPKVHEIADATNISLLQFHGDETPDYCHNVAKPYMKALRVQSQEDILLAQSDYDTASALLLDSFNQNSFGGTGECFDWNLIPEMSTKPFVLAGGLTAANVKTAIETIKPYAIDVSSGIESSRGMKDQNLMSQFMCEVYNAKKI